MFIKSTAAAALFALGALSYSTLNEQPEPPLRVQLSLGELDRVVELGEDFELELDGKRYAGRLEALPTRIFDLLGVTFEYPSSFIYECEDDDDFTTITLEGPSTLIMVQSYPADDDAIALAESVAESTAEVLSDLDCSSGTTKLSLGGETLNATLLEFTVAEYTCAQQIVGVDLEQGSIVLIVQTGIDDDGECTSEGSEVLELLDETFSVR